MTRSSRRTLGPDAAVLPRPDRTMTDLRCKLCRDERWVCEEHPDQPMGHDGCRGAGVPCPDCNPAGGPDEPPAPRRGFKTTAGRKHGPASLKRRAGGVIQQKAPARREALAGARGH
jgi:hypothetical protein